jgi:hypothetical protein
MACHDGSAAAVSTSSYGGGGLGVISDGSGLWGDVMGTTVTSGSLSVAGWVLFFENPKELDFKLLPSPNPDVFVVVPGLSSSFAGGDFLLDKEKDGIDDDDTDGTEGRVGLLRSEKPLSVAGDET